MQLVTSHTQRPSCRFPLALARSKALPEMSVVRSAALPEDEVAVPFTVDDRFHSHSKVLAISLAARGLWVSAGAWSSDHQKGGFVPDRVLSTLGGSPQLEKELLDAGLWKRVRRGIRFHDWEQWNDTADEAERKLADAERKREQARVRQQRKRAKAAAAEAPENVTRDVTRDRSGCHGKPQAGGTSGARSPRTLVRDVTQPECRPEKKPQVNNTPVTRDISVTPPSDDQDLDFDLYPGEVINQSSVRNAGAREADPEPGTPAFRIQVTAEMAARGCEIGDRTADVIAAEVLGLAKDPVPHKLGYVLKAIRRERDPAARWLPRRESRARLADPPPHCGDRWCSPSTRRREDPDTGGDLGPCPKCSGSLPVWEAS